MHEGAGMKTVRYLVISLIIVILSITPFSHITSAASEKEKIQ